MLAASASVIAGTGCGGTNVSEVLEAEVSGAEVGGFVLTVSLLAYAAEWC
jgi:hypothetical protein